ncbi:conserved hypothetical protein [Frankia sp. AiPs1]|uniref:hypothetical protein n=1 Tax=Frankia sp. AiPa1 TaxID=573492 RepID=UPI00202B9846|nr:hypothetical protein [Frankia sp. AiPa1]MCL9760898.1 hypothetical protein [Frankia sp. AiPa1]
MNGAALRTLVAFAVAAVAVYFGVQVLQEATEYHGGAGSQARTTVVFSVKDRGFKHGPDFAAEALWRGCVATIGWDGEDDPVAQGDQTYHATLRPSLPSDTRRRLRGCLEDLTMNHVRGRVVSMSSGPA